ncbi:MULTISPECIES: hypothetical protein [Pantoea]|nr:MULTISPECIES: hypothetical protein [Pantoea]MCH9269292.1 hypothetical protein [Pantoea ananatis]MDI3367401.1 hypothetical protein [Pantoea sp. V108_6]TDL59422.1 hypothetical protein E2R52_04575 [Pantoea ananatis]URL12952.1 hypothetical protein LVR30_11795 [Pantoea ananatis]
MADLLKMNTRLAQAFQAALRLAGVLSGDNDTVENNSLSLPGGLNSYGQASTSLGTSMTEAGAQRKKLTQR